MGVKLQPLGGCRRAYQVALRHHISLAERVQTQVSPHFPRVLRHSLRIKGKLEVRLEV